LRVNGLVFIKLEQFAILKADSLQILPLSRKFGGKADFGLAESLKKTPFPDGN
jgi:hypothetical protein